MLLFLVVTHGELQERFLSVLNSVMGSLNGSLTRLFKRSCFRLNIKESVLTLFFESMNSVAS